MGAELGALRVGLCFVSVMLGRVGVLDLLSFLLLPMLY